MEVVVSRSASAVRAGVVAGAVLLAVLCSGCGGSSGGNQPPPVPSFSLSVSPSDPVLASGGNILLSISVVPQNGFSETVTVQIAGLPAAVTTVPAAPFTVPPSGLQVTLYAANTVPPGAYALTVSGSSSTLQRSVGAQLQVAPPAVSLDSLLVNQLLYDPGRQRLYASVPEQAGANGNTIAVIDPAKKMVEQFIAVGADPNALAMTDDGQFLYVGLDAAGEVQRVNLVTRVAELKFTLGSSGCSLCTWGAADIAPLPGQPHSVAVALKYLDLKPSTAGVMVYDEGVRRANLALSYNHSIAFSDPATLYGFGDSALNVVSIDADGATIASNGRMGFTDGNPAIRYVNGRLYLGTGIVLTVPGVDTAGLFYTGPSRGMAVDAVAGRTYLLRDRDTSNAAIFAFDNNSFQETGWIDLPLPAGQGYSLVQCGSAGFALGTSTGVLITNAPLTPPPVIGPDAGGVPATHLLHDPVRDKLYATVPGWAGSLGNSVVVIDPYLRTIESAIYVGSEPDELGLSPDANALYVTLTGSRKVAKVDLLAGSLQYSFSLRQGDPGGPPPTPSGVAVSPADNDLVAVTGYGFANCTAAAMYDHGVQLPAVPPWAGCVGSVVFGATALDLYGYTDDTSPIFFRMQVDPTGITGITRYDSLLTGNYAVSQTDMERLHYSQGILYSTRGAALDPAGPTVIGTFVMPYPEPFTIPTSVAPDASAGQVYFLTYGPQTPPINLVHFDAQSFTLLGTKAVSGSLYAPYDLVRFGTSGIAFATNDHRIIFADVP